MVNKDIKTDFIVIGSGIAGCNFALKASKYGKVTLITKKTMMESNTNHAQGGIAGVIDQNDNFEDHFQDTLVAGALHNNKKAVRFLVKEGPKLIKKLVNLGVDFNKKNGELQLTREGGHNARRIAFSKDKTGNAIEKVLVKTVRNKNIKIFENYFASDLIIKNNKCYGVQVLDVKNKKVINMYSKAVVIATGGIGQLYKNTTNPKIATGDGLAMAARAGAKLKDLEFIQFHPTGLSIPGARAYLISEAVRGEGAVLRNSEGELFMHKYHPMKELAPRDIVARAIVSEEQKGTVYLDITHEEPEMLKKRFPCIYKKLKQYNLDLTKDQIPISPAAHFICGGVKTDLNGQTSINNLFAFGEVAWTGVHGANRLASNSLLEAIVFSNQIIKVLALLKNKVEIINVEKPKITSKKALIKKQIQQTMWDNVGILRDEERLKKAIVKLRDLDRKVYKGGINKELLETRNMLICSELVAKAALKRKNNLGAHYRLDAENEKRGVLYETK
ncbi:L-aspartate oxidase [Nanoarchaeota archaeon]